MHTVYGIRHHGPGSAKALLDALRAQHPDCILLEGPAEADAAIPYLGHEDMCPPVALLLYDSLSPSRAIYLPFAVFSPEWQALLYAHEQGTPLYFMDLPAAHSLAIRDEDDAQLAMAMPADADAEEMMADPIGYIARLAGFADSERWWEFTFEQRAHGAEVFTAILEMMSALRQDLGRGETRETLRREAYMRKTLRKALKDGYKNIAVVCGAWHAPVLHQLHSYKAAADTAVLKGLPKTKVATAWIPWSYDRLSRQSGYGAGVHSPAWYESLFLQPEDVTIHWMIRLAQLLRGKDLDASSAHVLEAVRLANTLAALRRQPKPSLAELQEAALAIFVHGEVASLKLIHDQLVIGTNIGRVPDDIPKIPLQQDLEQQVKTARLTKYWGLSGSLWLKATASNPRGGIDLRDAADLAKSHLLHRLRLLGISWGEAKTGHGADLGSFKELWQLEWSPELSIRIIEAGMWGNTVAEAATAKVASQLPLLATLVDTVSLTGEALRADLSDLVPVLMRQLQSQAALSQDVLQLMAGFPPIVKILQYGDVRGTDTSALSLVVAELAPRICVGLPAAAAHIDDEQAATFLQHLRACQGAFALLDNELFDQSWYAALRHLAEQATVHALLRGTAARLRFDKGQDTEAATAQYLHYALSAANPPDQIARWIEGFLDGSGLVLIHYPALWALVDAWLAGLDEATFTEVLPLLRRAFSRFSASERQKMLDLARHQPQVPVAVQPSALVEVDAFVAERAAPVLDTLRMLLGRG